MLAYNIPYIIILIVEVIATVILFKKLKALGPKLLMLIGSIISFLLLSIYAVVSFMLLENSNFEQMELYARIGSVYSICSIVAQLVFVLGFLFHAISIKSE